MCRKIVLLIIIILMLGMAGNLSASLVGKWTFDDQTANDSSGNGHNGTLTGNATIVNDGTRGYVVSLDGSGDYVNLGSGAWTNPGNNMTISAWFKVNSFPSNQLYTIFAKGLKTYRMARDSGSNNLLTVNANYNSSSYKYVTSTSNINVGWHHAAMTYDGTNMKLYIDGNLESTNTLSTLYTSTDPLMIGRNSGATARDWNGWIDDVSIYNNALTDSEIKVLAGWKYTISGSVGMVDGVTMGGLPGNPVTSGGGNYSATVVYGWNGTVIPSKASYGFNPSQMTYSNVTANQASQNYTPIADVNLAGRWNFDDSTANDASGYGHNGTLIGNAAIVNDAERGKVLSLDGSGDYVDLGNGAWTNPGNHMTVTAWIKVDTFDASWQTVIAKGLYTYRLSRNSTSSNMCTYMNYSSGTNYHHADGTSIVNDGNWHYVGMSYNGTTMKLYVDGQVQGTSALSTLYTSTANLCIGRNTDGTSRDWQGWIDDVRLYNKVLSDAEVVTVAGTSYTISGSVGTLDGVTMNGLPGNPSTSGGGNYSATVAFGWAGTVTPAKNGYTFTPASKTYSNVVANQTAQNYTPIVPTYTISGTVGSLDGVAMGGFPVETISTGGSYSATVTLGWSGTITPAMNGYTFSPSNKIYSNVTSNQTSQNYTPALITYTISGHTGSLDGVTISGLPGNPVTSGGGAYSATVTCIWSGTVTPAKTGYTFSPSYRQYSNIASNLTEDYTPILNTYTISGNAGGIGEVTMSGLPGNPVLSSPDGTYSAVVNYGWTGTVTPTKSLYNFSPINKTYSNISADQNGQDYTSSSALGDPNLVGWWPFNGDVLDYSGYGHNGTLTGASYVNSDIGTVLEFDGVDYVAIPSITFATIHDEVTIALWQYGDAAIQPQADDIFEGWDSSNHRVLNAHLPYSNSVVYWDAGYAGTSYDRINKTTTSASQYEGQWNHWVFTKDLSVEQMKIYLNGVLWHSGTAKSKSMSGVTQFKIGSAADGAYNYDGMICEFKIYDKAMTAAEVDALYNASYEVSNPSPADHATGVATTADISWTKGYLAADTSGHDVYFGTDVTLVTNRSASVHKGIQTDTTYDPGTLASGRTYYWAVDEVNDYYENSPWLGDVYSFTTIGSGPTCPVCGGAGLCNLTITNYQGRLSRISGVQKVNIIRVVMPGKTSKDWSNLKYSVNSFINFCNKGSFGRIQFQLGVTTDFNEPVCRYNEAQTLVTPFSNSLPEALVTVIFFPEGVAGFSHAGGGRCMMAGNLIRDVIHEAGHVLGLAHSNALQADGTVKGSADPSSYMSSLASCQNYAVNQQHWLGWLDDPGQAINITDCLNKVDYIDVPVAPIGSGGVPKDVPFAYSYDIPGTDQRVWISMPKAMDNSTNGIKGGEIFVYQAPNCRGKTGMCSGDTVYGRIRDVTIATPHDIDGLTITPISYQATIGQYNGHNVNNYSQVTLRISLTGTPDTNDYNEPDTTPVANWDFTENAGTTLRNTVNDGTTAPATWTADVAGVTTTGNNTLNFAPTTNTINGSVSYFDLASAGTAFTTGKVWTVIEVIDFNFAGSTIGERLRFGLTNATAINNITAECQIRRVASNSIHLMGFSGGTLSSTGVQICNSNTFTGLIEICTAYDFDARTYQIFYRIGGSGEWNSVAAPAALSGTNMGNAVRLCAGETGTTGNGSWRDTNEYFRIGRIYVTKTDPTIEIPNNPPDVWISWPDDGDTFTLGSNITIQASAGDSDGTVTGVQFYNGANLLGNGTPPTVQNNIVNTAATATIHGATARYEAGGNNIGYWTNMNDWVSWTPSVTRTGTFDVWVNYACPSGSAGSIYRVEVDGHIVQGTVAGTGGWTTYNSVSLGTVDLSNTGTINVNVIPETMPNGAVMNLRDVTLIPTELDNCYQYTWSNVQAGTYTITAKATDDDSDTTTSDPVVITVQP